MLQARIRCHIDRYSGTSSPRILSMEATRSQGQRFRWYFFQTTSRSSLQTSSEGCSRISQSGSVLSVVMIRQLLPWKFALKNLFPSSVRSFHSCDSMQMILRPPAAMSRQCHRLSLTGHHYCNAWNRKRTYGLPNAQLARGVCFGEFFGMIQGAARDYPRICQFALRLGSDLLTKLAPVFEPSAAQGFSSGDG